MRRAFLALILGLGFTALICLAINIPLAGLLIFALLAPGAIPWASFAPTANGDSIPLLFGTNALFYSILAYLLIFFRFRNVSDKTYFHYPSVDSARFRAFRPCVHTSSESTLAGWNG
jgi:hypothetical protein